ncbi:glycosyltransferase family 4 protein [Streptomyces glomeratus]|uniref:Glycosyl transferase family 1 domain-containing protein n=1 Tax=Streptomyces glomeratus TaxID=284452 RepID=A0ABP6LEI3_9ACTN|nr:glycosyltransferase family 4 protein [Streptomyces glomeratus]MCF1506632.1 glycosyltransferase family 4 protein [Streptomyces glomeratus]
MGRAAEFFTPVLTSRCNVRAVISLSASRAGSDRLAASWPAKATATLTALAKATYMLIRTAPNAVYLPVSQWGLPLLRDVLLILLAKAAGATPVLHLHGAQLPTRLAASRVLRASLGGCHWVVLSETVAEQLGATGCRSASVTVLRNPAPPATPSSRESAPSRALRVGWIGTMSRVKGFDLVCGAVDVLKRQGLEVEFRVAGIRHDVPPSHMACVDEDLGVLDLSEALSFWTKVDVFVLPARWVEGLPFALLEGLQAGCTVAATPSPGSAELFGQGCVEPVEATVESVAGFLKACEEDIEDIRQRQQKAWKELRPRYERDCITEEFVRFWQNMGLARHL